MQNFLKHFINIIITDYKIYINFLGFKIKHRRKSVKYIQNKYSNYSAFDLPKAEGNLRKLQLAELKVLKMFDKFCQDNNLEYWLEHGTMLGAFRNKGFITWDDDIDIGMMRDDYEKLIYLLKNNQLHKDLKLTFETNGRHLCLLKIVHKKLECIQFDIFPYDYYYKKTDSIEKYDLTLKLMQLTNKKNYPVSDCLNIFNPKKVMEKFRKITKEKVLEGYNADKTTKPSIFCGIDFPYFSRKCLVFDYEAFFPLKRFPFEDAQFLCPNDTQTVLEYIFEDYIKIPNNCYPHHFGSETLPKRVINDLDEFLKD